MSDSHQPNNGCVRRSIIQRERDIHGLKNDGENARVRVHILMLFYVITPANNSINAGAVNLAEKEGRMKNSNFQGKEKKAGNSINSTVAHLSR